MNHSTKGNGSQGSPFSRGLSRCKGHVHLQLPLLFTSYNQCAWAGCHIGAFSSPALLPLSCDVAGQLRMMTVVQRALIKDPYALRPPASCTASHFIFTWGSSHRGEAEGPRGEAAHSRPQPGRAAEWECAPRQACSAPVGVCIHLPLLHPVQGLMHSLHRFIQEMRPTGSCGCLQE